ncbi:MAG: DUF1194 domain-containing protein, partial [Rhodobacter sp.]|nr:DUF1194 domain-containing protein [Rhodobacter sp.]
YSSDGMTRGEFYAGKPAAEVTVNVLVTGGESRPHLWKYFNDEVLRGPGAFSLSTIDYQDFPRAMKVKLLRELNPPRLSGEFERRFMVR